MEATRYDITARVVHRGIFEDLVEVEFAPIQKDCLMDRGVMPQKEMRIYRISVLGAELDRRMRAVKQGKQSTAPEITGEIHGYLPQELESIVMRQITN